MPSEYSQSWPLVVLRYATAAMFLIHGVTRVANGGVEPFGGFLAAQGFPMGVAWAWAVTLLEIFAAPVLALGYCVVPLAAYFVLQTVLGIALVHWKSGWFVVGAGRNGMEYSVLLIVCLACLILDARQRAKAG